MATGANISEDYSISDARTGSIRVSRLVLSGHGAAPSASAGLKAWSDHGRLWGVFTYASANSGNLSLLRRTADGGTDEVCSGTVANGKVELAADNTSGISGTADVDDGTPGTNPSADATFDVVVSYDCDEIDLFEELDAAESLLESGTWQGAGTRFEKLLNKAKRKLDQWIIASHLPRIRLDEYGRYLLAHLVNISDLTRCQALLAAHMATLGRAGFIDQAIDRAAFYLEAARDEFKTFTPVFDYERDGQPDNRALPGVIRLERS